MSEDKVEDVTEDQVEDDTTVTLEKEEPTSEDKETEGEGDTEDQEKKEETDGESDEIEVVREVKGDQPSKKTKSFTNRIKKLKGETQQESERADGAEQENRILREQLKLKDLALDAAKNQPKAPIRPNPDDFDDGAGDSKFVEKLDEFYDHRTKYQIEKGIAEFSKTNTQTIADTTQEDKLDRVLMAYQETASKVSPKDHEAKEDVAIKVLGNKTVNGIISNWKPEEAALVVYHLGCDANADEAKEVRDLFANDPVGGVKKIEGLLREISFKPKNNNKLAPEPDEELPGGSASYGKRGPPGAKFY